MFDEFVASISGIRRRKQTSRPVPLPLTYPLWLTESQSGGRGIASSDNIHHDFTQPVDDEEGLVTGRDRECRNNTARDDHHAAF